MGAQPIPRTADTVLIEPMDFVKSGKLDSGIWVQKPKFQGTPTMGRIFAVSGDEKELKPGMLVAFSEKQPDGFHWEGKGILPVSRKNIGAVIDETPTN